MAELVTKLLALLRHSGAVEPMVVFRNDSNVGNEMAMVGTREQEIDFRALTELK